MPLRLTLTFADLATYSYLMDPEEITPDCRPGAWYRPFPNQRGNSFAFGEAEAAEQSDLVLPLIMEHGQITMITVTDEEE